MRICSATTIALALIVSAVATACSTSGRDTKESAGEAAIRSTPDTAVIPVRWLTDANLFSLFGTMNARQIAAADVELESWHVDSVRAFAVTVAREHAELQHLADSVAQQIRVVPIAPALSQPVSATMQAQIDSLRRAYGHSLDRVFIRQQVASYQFMTDEMSELAAVAERSEVQSLFAAARDSMNAQLARARTLQARLAVADSTVAADSAAKLAAKAARAAARRDRRSAVP